MVGWLRRTWRRLRDEPPRRALKASGYEVAAGTVGRAASSVYGHRADPTSIWERDWDVLCLLDGCRLDLLQTVATDGDWEFLPPADGVESIWSVGSQSAEWMAATFGTDHAQSMAQTAYVTGNPFSAQSADQLAAIETDPLPLDAGDFGLLYEAWREEWTDSDISTIPPAPLTDAAIAAWRNRERLDLDRVVVHYMQPHTPFRSRPDWFLGTADIESWGQLDDGDDGDTSTDTSDPYTGDTDLTDDGATDDEGDAGGACDADEEVALEDLDEETRELLEALDARADVGRDPWTRLRDGELPEQEFWAAYRDNLEWVLADVARLVENCDGTVVLTSDHGNAAGEFGVWSHPPAVHLPALREVPWVEVAGTDRHTVDPELPAEAMSSADPGRSPATDDRETAEQRLADLGYR